MGVALVPVAMFVCSTLIGSVQLHNTSQLELAQFGWMQHGCSTNRTNLSGKCTDLNDSCLAEELANLRLVAAEMLLKLC